MLDYILEGLVQPSLELTDWTCDSPWFLIGLTDSLSLELMKWIRVGP
jgi:hypothetical protein